MALDLEVDAGWIGRGALELVWARGVEDGCGVIGGCFCSGYVNALGGFLLEVRYLVHFVTYVLFVCGR